MEFFLKVVNRISVLTVLLIFIANISIADENQILIEGEVNVPGWYVAQENTVTNLILEAGGLTDRACMSQATIFGMNKEKSKELSHRFYLPRILERKENDILIPQGWIVTFSEGYLCLGISAVGINERISRYVRSVNALEVVVYNSVLIDFYHGNSRDIP